MADGLVTDDVAVDLVDEPWDVPVLPLSHRRRTWEELDALRARMLHDGYPLLDLSAQDNEYVWRSLAGRVRRPELGRLLGMTDAVIDARVDTLRRQRLAATGRR